MVPFSGAFLNITEARALSEAISQADEEALETALLKVRLKMKGKVGLKLIRYDWSLRKNTKSNCHYLPTCQDSTINIYLCIIFLFKYIHMFIYWHFFNIQTILRAHNLQTIQATHPPLRFTGLNQKSMVHPFKASDAGIMNSTVEEAEDWNK